MVMFFREVNELLQMLLIFWNTFLKPLQVFLIVLSSASVTVIIWNKYYATGTRFGWSIIFTVMICKIFLLESTIGVKLFLIPLHFFS